MPLRKCSNGKYAIGNGACIYTKESGEKAYAAYRARKHAKEEVDMGKGTKRAGTLQFFAVQEGIQAGADDDWVLRNVALCGGRSVNGRRYPAAVRKRRANLYEGASVFANHDPTKDASKVRDVQDLLGSVHGVWFDEAANMLKAKEMHLIADDPLAAKVRTIARTQPHILGLSHEARVRYAKTRQSGDLVVEDIQKVRRVAVVTESATTANLFEAADSVGGDDMEWDDVTVEAVKENAPEVVEALTKEIRESLETEVREEVEKTVGKDATVEKLKADLVEAQSGDKDKKIADLTKQLENGKLVDEAVGESKIPPRLVTAAFRKSLMAMEGKEDMVEACKDRMLVANEKPVAKSDDASEAAGGGSGEDGKPTAKDAVAAVKG